MKKKFAKRIFMIGILLLIASLLMVACSSGNDSGGADTSANAGDHDDGDDHADDAAPADDHDDGDDHGEELVGDMVRGGKLYDKWWNVAASEDGHEHEGDDHDAGGAAPDGDHPLWATQDNNTRSGGDTWRCKECHGWDYMGVDGAYGGGSHMTGFPGINGVADMDAAAVLEIMKGSTNSDHDFSAYMPEQDLIDLSLFISEGQIDYAILVNDDKSSTGDVTAGEETYTEVCGKCHGVEGNAINFHGIDDPEFLGHLAPGNPWEFIHKVRFGQPGWPMPSAIANDWTLEEIANVLAYAQTFPEDPFISGGGQVYDKWWVVLGLEEPTTDQPLWATQDSNTREGKDTWRCKECHGWDYMGADGAYGGGSHFTGFVGVFGAADYATADLIAWLDGTNNPDHAFPFDEVGFNAVATFIQNGVVDVTGFINDDKSVNGDPLLGSDMFEGTCQFCHGSDGKLINFGHDDDPEYLGTVASGNPWEFFHKVAQGQPGSPMPAGLALGWTLEDIANLAAFAQTLPTE